MSVNTFFIVGAVVRRNSKFSRGWTQGKDVCPPDDHKEKKRRKLGFLRFE
jgi:hypothetical protein